MTFWTLALGMFWTFRHFYFFSSISRAGFCPYTCNTLWRLFAKKSQPKKGSQLFSKTHIFFKLTSEFHTSNEIGFRLWQTKFHNSYRQRHYGSDVSRKLEVSEVKWKLSQTPSFVIGVHERSRTHSVSFYIGFLVCLAYSLLLLLF